MNPLQALQMQVLDVYPDASVVLDGPTDGGFWDMRFMYERHWLYLQWGKSFGKIAMWQVKPTDEPEGFPTGDPVGDVTVDESDLDGAFRTIQEWLSVPGPWTREACEKDARDAIARAERIKPSTK